MSPSTPVVVMSSPSCAAARRCSRSAAAVIDESDCSVSIARYLISRMRSAGRYTLNCRMSSAIRKMVLRYYSTATGGQAGPGGGEEPMSSYEVVPIGWVESPLKDRAQAPRQGDEGAPDAWLVIEPGVAEGVRDLAAGSEIIVLTWLDRADRAVLATRP